MVTREPLRSRLSWARLERISFARWSASMRCARERSGAAGIFVAVFGAGGTGSGESTSSSDTNKPPERKIPRSRPELEGDRGWLRRNRLFAGKTLYLDA